MGIHYRCSTCGKMWKENVWPRQCLVCLRPLCGDCDTNGLCQAHFAQLSPEDQQALYNASRTLEKAEARQITGTSVFLIIFSSFVGLIILQAFVLVSDLDIRVAVLSITFVGIVAGGILAWTRLRSRTLFCRRMKAGILEKNWIFPGEMPPTDESALDSSPPLVCTPELSFPSGIPQEFRDAFTAWKAGQYPLPKSKSDVLIIPRNGMVFFANLLLAGSPIGATIAVASLATYEAITWSLIDILISFFLAFLGIIFLICGTYFWRMTGIKARVIFVSPRGILLFRWRTLSNIPWDDVGSVIEESSGIGNVAITLKSGQVMKFWTDLWRMVEVLWSPLFIEGKQWPELISPGNGLARQWHIGRKKSYMARLQKPNTTPLHINGVPSLLDLFQKYSITKGK